MSARRTFRKPRRQIQGAKPAARVGSSATGANQPKRTWVAARMKVDGEARCRACGADDTDVKLEAAHIIGREHDRTRPVDHREEIDGPWQQPFVVVPRRIIPLCSACHDLDHHGELDTLPLLDLAEQLQAVADAGGVELMRLRTMPSENPKRSFVGQTNMGGRSA